jgi:hypothetical protein
MEANLSMFRVWDEDNKEYASGNYYLDQNGRLLIASGWGDSIGEIGSRNLLVERCCGISDRNGNPIFANTVLTHNYIQDVEPDVISVVYDADFMTFIVILSNGGFEYLHKFDMRQFEISGNTHEGKFRK